MLARFFKDCISVELRTLILFLEIHSSTSSPNAACLSCRIYSRSVRSCNGCVSYNSCEVSKTNFFPQTCIQCCLSSSLSGALINAASKLPSSTYSSSSGEMSGTTLICSCGYNSIRRLIDLMTKVSRKDGTAPKENSPT